MDKKLAGQALSHHATAQNLIHKVSIKVKRIPLPGFVKSLEINITVHFSLKVDPILRCYLVRQHLIIKNLEELE